MQTIDIILGCFLLYGLIRGFRNGFFIELASLFSLILGIYLALKFSSVAQVFISSHVSWSPKTIQISAFALTFIAVIVGLSILAKFMTTVAKFVGMSLVNKFAGAFFGLLKTILVMSVALHFFNKMNSKMDFVSKDQLIDSTLYYPTLEVSGKLYPVLESWFDEFYPSKEER
ncbi:CvpA family protein [Flavobacterium tegetincola]|uniref:CvpA family protein n=1 Tax=Flavobacterium tegetincola TaxID=150172 RepID=UPI00041C533A|nr:CvpA family protein [Flavobacterium tegetincola]